MMTSESTDLNPPMVSAASGVPLMSDGEINDTLDHSVVTPWVEYNLSTNALRASAFEIMVEYYPAAFITNRVLTVVCYVVGFFGNTISAVAWFQPRLMKRNSSAVYLALLSISDLVFLVLSCAGDLDKLLDTQLSALASLCEVYFFFFLIPQYLTPLLVLGFTAERYIAICHPLLCRVLCRFRIAVTVCILLTISSVLLASIQPLFWTYSSEVKYCSLRKSIPGIESLWFVMSLVVEVIVFMIVPMATLVLDVQVIRCLVKVNQNPLTSVRSGGVSGGACESATDGITGERGDRIRVRGEGRAGKIGVALVEPLREEAERGGGVGGNGGERGTGREVDGLAATDGEMRGGRKVEQSGSRRIRVPYQVTTALLLAVSLFEIATIVPVSILYLLKDYYVKGPAELSKEEMLADPTWKRYFPFLAAIHIIMSLCMTRHATLVFFYLALGPRFRETLCDLVRCRRPPIRAELTRTTLSRTSVSSVRSQHHLDAVRKHRTPSRITWCDVGHKS